jgi:hypothetical protein
VWQSFLRSEPLHIPLSPVGAMAEAAAEEEGESPGFFFLWKLLSMGVAALVLLALLAGIVNQVRGPEPAVTTAPVSGGVEEPNGAAVQASIPETAMPPIDQPLPAVAVEEIDLPPSKNAPPDITIGRRVRIRDRATLTLRTEPGATAGEVVGYMQNREEATVIGGPTQLPGISDTIVWWEVQLDNGSTAWAAANDSTMYLLELVD